MFSCIAIFNIIRIPMYLLPHAITETVKLKVSIKRIDKFINKEDVTEKGLSFLKIQLFLPCLLNDAIF